MKKSDSAVQRKSQAARGIKWNEENLDENEKIKSALNTSKVTEPKTPFHGPQSSTSGMEDDEDLKPLALDEHAEHGNGLADMEEHGGRSGFSSDSERRASATGGSDSDGTDEQKKKFAQLRKQHYNMKAAMQKPDDDEEDSAEAPTS